MRLVRTIEEIKHNDIIYSKDNSGNYVAYTVDTVVNKSLVTYIVTKEGAALFLNNGIYVDAN